MKRKIYFAATIALASAIVFVTGFCGNGGWMYSDIMAGELLIVNQQDTEAIDCDSDGIPYAVDNCPCHFNIDQRDWNSDGIGDACDTDLDPCTEYANYGDCRGRITIEKSGTKKKIPYYRNYPLGTPNSAIYRAVISLHGISRASQGAFRDVVDAAISTGAINNTLIMAPHFSTDDDAPASDELYWSSGGWVQGEESEESPWVSSFEVMDQIVDKLNDASKFPNLEEIIIIGHSAGGQYTHRYAAGSQAENSLHGIRVRYVVSNPSSYMYLNLQRARKGTLNDFHIPITSCQYCKYRYGLYLRNDYMNQIVDRESIRSQFKVRDVVYFVGEDDTGSDKLDTGCEAMWQGENRYRRAVIFKNYMDAFFSPHNHTLTVVPGVGHHGYDMYNSAQGLTVLFGQSMRNTLPDSDGDGIVDPCEPCFRFRGDITLDGNINILDALAAVNHILDLVPLEGNVLWAGDCNGDDIINILDVLAIVNVILGITPECPGDGEKPEVGEEAMEFLKSLESYLAAEDFTSVMAMVKAEVGIPTEYLLAQNYPNPFNPVTTIEYALPEASRVKVEVYNLLGQVVDVLVDSGQEVGYHSIQWDASEMASGVYFYQLTTTDFTIAKRMVLMK